MTEVPVSQQVLNQGPPLSGVTKAQVETKLTFLGQLWDDDKAEKRARRHTFVAVITFIATIASIVGAVATVLSLVHH